MFSNDIHVVYESVKQPVWMSHGVRGNFADYRNQKIVASRPNWRFDEFPTGALPYFEVPRDFFADLDAFLRAPANR